MRTQQSLSKLARSVGVVGALVLGLGACSSPGEAVSSLDGTDTQMVNGFANQATAEYAECLEAEGLTVSAVEDVEARGHVEIDGALPVADDDGKMTVDSPIAVDGTVRDAEIAACRERNPGFRDVYVTQAVGAEDDAPASGTVEAGRIWAECARSAGFAMIEDPVDGDVAIPESMTLDDALALGEACSHPLKSEDDPAPSFFIQAGVPVTTADGTTAIDIAPIASAIMDPLYENLPGPPEDGAPDDGPPQ